MENKACNPVGLIDTSTNDFNNTSHLLQDCKQTVAEVPVMLLVIYRTG